MKTRFFAALLSFTLPGLGQIYNRQFFKGVILLLLEHIDNNFAHINLALMLCLNGRHTEALQQVDYQYALFYPGFYTLCVFDSVINADHDFNKNGVFWFILSGVFGCLGIIYSRYIPVPLFTVGLSLIILMSIGTYVGSKI